MAWEGVAGVTSFVTSQNELVYAEKQKRRIIQANLDQAVNERRLLKADNLGVRNELALNKAKFDKKSAQLIAERDLLSKRERRIAQKLSSNQKIITKLKQDAANPLSKRVLFKGRKIAVSEAVSNTTETISKRAAKSAAREIASMPGEGIPVWGTAVIVSVTALELYDLCQTIKDMNALRRAFDPSLEPGPEEQTVCSLRVPTREELWTQTKSAPGQAWDAAKEFTPTLEDIKEWRLPEL